MTDAGLLKRYDTGIYFIPKKSIFKSGTQLSMNTVIEKKYLQDNNERCGYISGIAFANQLGITTKVSMACEVVTKKVHDRMPLILEEKEIEDWVYDDKFIDYAINKKSPALIQYQEYTQQTLFNII